jgi:chromosome segregation ATPase
VRPAKFAKLAGLAFGLAGIGQHAAFADATTEAQLRAALQSSTAQIATLEDQVANLQASQAPDVATIEALRAQLQNLQSGKGGIAGTAASNAKNDAALAALKKQLAARNAALANSQSAYATASSAASAASSENAALKAQLDSTNSSLASCQTKNTELFNLGNQILDAYSHKDDLFGSIADREPFTGLKRVQLENIVQDDQDKLLDNHITPATAPP